MNAPKLLMLLLATGVLGASACATVKTNPQQQAPVETLAMDPMLIKASANSDEGEVQTEVYESGSVFVDATQAFKKRRYDEAVRLYGIIIDNFRESDYYLPALYNSGLAYERLNRFDDALEMYRVVMNRVPDSSEATDAMYRTAECRKRLEDWAGVVRITEKILERDKLGVYDLVEARVRLADALLELGELSRAETTYREAITLNNRADPEQAIPKDSHFVAGAHFGISRVYHALFGKVVLKLPLEKMEADLEDKAQLFMQAQSKYIRTMRLGNPYWSTAAGYNIGKMYEEFYAHILRAEIPTDLTEEELEVYFDVLRKKIRPLMERAVQIYEKNITLSERFGVDNDFTEESQKSLERLKRYITDDKLQARDERLIRSGKGPDTIGVEPGAEPVPDETPQDRDGDDGDDEDRDDDKAREAG